jgi:hypothetical protein
MSDVQSPAIIADTLPDEIPTLYEGPSLDLPAGAEQNPDGSVTLTLEYPKKLTFRAGADVREERLETLTFHRVTGADARKFIVAKDKAVVGFAACARVTPARANLIINALDAADGMAAAEVVIELLGGALAGLPDNAVSSPEGVQLTLTHPVTDAEGKETTDLFFPRMTVAQRNKVQAQPDMLDFAVSTVLKSTPKEAHDLLDRMDGADLRSVNRVMLFLFGIGRRT